MFWLGKYYWIDFVNSTKADLPALKYHLERHPKAASTASPLEGTSKGYTILIKCRPSEFNEVVKNVEQVDNTKYKSYTYVGYMTSEGHKKLKWAVTYPPADYFITLGGSLGSDSGIAAWAQNMNVLTSFHTFTSQFVPLLIKAAFVAIWPTITALVVVAKKNIGT